MGPKPIIPGSGELFRQTLREQINLKHPLVKLADLIEWERIDAVCASRFTSGRGRPATSPRLIAGLLYLQHAFDLSDDDVVWGWVENPYWQVFTGETYLQIEPPIDPSSLTRWRQRLGEEGIEELLAVTISAGQRSGAVRKNSLKTVIVDTTVMPKAVAHPTDSRLLERTLRSRVGRVWRDIDRQKDAVTGAARQKLDDLLARSHRILTQRTKDKNKLYALHAPEVECISKGKARTPYEFGVKVSITTTLKEGFVVGARSMPGNPYDGHTLPEALEQTGILGDTPIHTAVVDRGYRGVEVPGTRILRSGQRRGITKGLKAMIKRRSAIEPTIGHMKSDGKLDRNWLKGRLGDAIHAILCGAGHNIRLLLRRLRLFYALVLVWLAGGLNEKHWMAA